jgi:glycosyltransferase involved in cell wall biosynthesis
MHSGLLNLLILTPTFPYPPVSGGDIRTYHLLRRLSPAFDVHLLPYAAGRPERLIQETGIVAVHGRDPASAASRSWLLRRRITLWRKAPHGISLLVDPSYAQALKRVLANTRFHGVLIDHLYMMQYARLVRPLPVFYSAPDVETIKFARWHEGERLPLTQRLFHWAQCNAIRWHESRVGRTARVTFATSEVDRGVLLQLNRTGRFVVVPNGVDLKYFRARSRASFDQPPAVFFVGTMYYKPNHLAARFLAHEIFPVVRREIPEATCHLVGKTGAQDYSELNRPELGVRMHGFVEDIRPFFEQCRLLVAPLSVGSGTRIKILEAMATGTPVVSTTIGAEGLDYTDGENILIANTPSALSAAVLRLLRDPGECFRMGAAGRRLVESKYSWDSAGDIMRTEIARVLESEVA